LKILIATDAWAPQTNGVVRTYETLGKYLILEDHDLFFITPDMFFSIPLITYPEIRLAINAWFSVGKKIRNFKPDIIHIATEGPIGLATRNYCTRHKFPFTTAYCTKFPEYIYERFRVPLSFTYKIIKWFHKNSYNILVTTETIRNELKVRGITNTSEWTRGVDLRQFNHESKIDLKFKKPIYLYVGRVSVEKSIDDFLDLELDGTKLVVGDGPYRKKLEKKYKKNSVFVGAKFGKELASYYASSDVFVFPSKSDTFGMVMIEALACGIPVAAYPVPGPLDIFSNSDINVLDKNLEISISRALQIDSQECIDHAKKFTWENCAKQFMTSQKKIEYQQ
jgi:glycosyltransferase involved in cell wall biosynthesis